MAAESVSAGAVARPTNESATGATVAAIFAAGFGLLVLALVQVGTVLSRGFGDFVFSVGKAWIPNAQGIGPYSGKETFLLVAWIGSWVVLHYALRRRTSNIKTLFAGFLVILLAATLLMWPPVWHVLKGA